MLYTYVRVHSIWTMKWSVCLAIYLSGRVCLHMRACALHLLGKLFGMSGEHKRRKLLSWTKSQKANNFIWIARFCAQLFSSYHSSALSFMWCPCAFYGGCFMLRLVKVTFPPASYWWLIKHQVLHQKMLHCLNNKIKNYSEASVWLIPKLEIIIIIFVW